MIKLVYRSKPNYEYLKKFGLKTIIEDEECNIYIVYLERKPF